MLSLLVKLAGFLATVFLCAFRVLFDRICSHVNLKILQLYVKTIETDNTKMTTDSRDFVLSIQSTVVSGYCGNKVACFTLQVLGYDVCPVNSVQLSNHTEYGYFKGQVLNGADLDVLYDGLKHNKLHEQFSHILTGYVASKPFLEKVADIVQDIKKINPSMTFVCDPVMGDHDHLYVPEDLVPVYRDIIAPLADIITPNQYELELLTDRKIKNEEEAFSAMQVLHDKGPSTVVLSSTDIGDKDILVALASTVKGGVTKKYRVEMKNLDAKFVGTGDLFASCLLASLHKDKDLKIALEKTISTIQAVIKRTLESAKAEAGPRKEPNWAQMELRLIQSKKDIESPVIEYTATQK